VLFHAYVTHIISRMYLYFIKVICLHEYWLSSSHHQPNPKINYTVLKGEMESQCSLFCCITSTKFGMYKVLSAVTLNWIGKSINPEILILIRHSKNAIKFNCHNVHPTPKQRDRNNYKTIIIIKYCIAIISFNPLKLGWCEEKVDANQ
jgi:hypothetical protein